MCYLQEKKKQGEKRKGRGEWHLFSSKTIFRQDWGRMLRFFKVKGLKSIKFGEHFMASTPYKRHLWVDDQASLWLSSYHAQLITFWKNSIHHSPSTFRESSAKCPLPFASQSRVPGTAAIMTSPPALTGTRHRNTAAGILLHTLARI